MAEKILSVSIAAYNVQETLAEALEPFAAEGIRDCVDVMIVNDGSKDNTAVVAKAYIDRYPDTFRLINKENGGWGSTLNVGIQEAKGKYFKQLDGDDFFSPENLKMFLSKLEKTSSDMVYTPFVSFDHKTGGILRIIGSLEHSYEIFPIEKEVLITHCRGFFPAMHTLTVKTSLLLATYHEEKVEKAKWIALFKRGIKVRDTFSWRGEHNVRLSDCRHGAVRRGICPAGC